MATAMFQRLRLGSSKDKTSQQTRRASTIPTPSSASRGSPPRPASLLGLPPELRNLVFEFVAIDTNLTLAIPSKRRVKRPAVVGLLLVNRQTYREFYPVLLAKARISTPIANFNFGSVPTALDRRSQDELQWLSVNPRIYLTQLISHTPRKEELDNLADWLSFRAQEGSHAHPDTAKAAPKELVANSLFYRYDAKLDPPRSMANPVNMRVALLTALIRQLARLTGPEYGGAANKVERQRMMVDLTEYKDVLMGVERTLAEREAELGSDAVKKDSPFFGVQFTGMPLR